MEYRLFETCISYVNHEDFPIANRPWWVFFLSELVSWESLGLTDDFHVVILSGTWLGGGFKHMDVSKNSGTPKWMVYNGKPY